MASSRSLLLPIGLVLSLLFIDAAISLSLVSSMVAFLHTYGGGPFPIEGPFESTFLLAGEPAHLVVNQGHTTNGANGTVLVLVGFGGCIALWLERRSRRKYDRSSPAFYVWALIVFLSCLLTLTALIYTFVETSKTGSQEIDYSVARATPAPAHYPNDRWTPENWYAAVLELPLVSDDDRRVIQHNLTLMRGWRWNLIPMFLLGFALLSLVVLELLRLRRRSTQKVPMEEVLA
ncbi:030a2135-d6bf-41b3-b0b6-b9dad91b38f4 [Thermothielavioides terrestris]|uniref:Uncharacterized protein n=2 Tax=Thermothielavioides terrestris TaxID=2587410 RepID=G2RHR5_THETT|nr:uncharacterized protein THITE_2123655 [Thermothielavioides terrestris NRRL 8126]AEO71377.1 hypothetical protein THITE_2123655 [Thermothielavioides terrestris NRRL 8126]SPQ27644.1 030a2135-d6bf-41b3-b0b6-b9dad91b38f4 [Thermothielavioides terrestris]